MSPARVVRHADVHAFAARATPWLLHAEAEHNLLLGIIEQLKAHRLQGGDPYLVTIEENDAVVGCAFRTPPYKLGLTRMPHGAIAALVNDVGEVFQSIPAVMGPSAQARAFAEAWALCKGAEAQPGMRQRIYILESVNAPSSPAAGELRLAGRRDTDLLVGWLNSFAAETGIGTVNVQSFVESHIANKTIFLWEDQGQPVTSALYSGKTPNGVRIGFVYTPPDMRRKGYASACVAAISQRALDVGNRFCCLYTDLSNPTSNDIYQRIGYVPVCDVGDYNIK